MGAGKNRGVSPGFPRTGSECVFQRELHDSSIARRHHLSERVPVELRDRIAPNEAVGYVERLDPELHALSFPDLEPARQRHIKLPRIRTLNVGLTDIAERARCRLSKSGRIEVLV